MHQSLSTSPAAARWLAHPQRWMLAAVLVGLVLRLSFALGYWVGKPLTLDEQEYLVLARSLTEGRGFTYEVPGESEPPRRHVGRAPLYPVFLAAILVVSGGSNTAEVGHATDSASAPPGGHSGPVSARALTAVKFTQAVVGALSLWLIGVLATRIAGPTAGVVAASVGAVYPPLVWICGYMLSETLFSALALGGALLLDIALDRDAASRWRMALAAGAVVGLATLARPAMMAFLMLATVFLFVRRQPALAVALLAGAAIVISPWTIRNAREHGRFVLVASEGGVTFWTGNHPLARGEGDMAANPAIKRDYLAIEARFPGLTAEEMEPIYYGEALRFIAAHPLEWAGLLARKLFYAVVPMGPSYRLHSNRYVAASVLPYLCVLPFAVAGILRLRRQPCPPRALWLMAASAVVVSLVFFPQERFRIPVIDPTLIVCAAAWWAGSPRVAAVLERLR